MGNTIKIERFHTLRPIFYLFHPISLGPTGPTGLRSLAFRVKTRRRSGGSS